MCNTITFPSQSIHSCYFLHSEQSPSSQAAFSKPPPSATNHVAEGRGGGETSVEEVELLLTNQKASSRQPSFLRALIKAFGPYFLIGSGFKLMQDIITFVNPQLLRYKEKVVHYNQLL